MKKKKSFDFIFQILFFISLKLLLSLAGDKSLLCLLSCSSFLPGGSDSKASAYNAGEPASIAGSGRSPDEENGNPLQYPCLGNPMDGGAWWTTVRGVTKNQTGLRDFTFTFILEGH